MDIFSVLRYNIDMAKQPKVSILVPICNVEKYLAECLESVTAQTLKDIEIICLNDGSTDGSLEIINEYASRDRRIIVIDKPNSGYGDSMNLGLKTAKGEYIGIVESDDWVDLEMFEDLYRLAKQNDAEVVRGNYYHYKNGQSTKFIAVDPAQVGYVVDPRQRQERHIFYEAPAIWSAIYHRDFLKKHQIEFLSTPGASYQDTGFNFKVWASARRAVFTNNAYLHYRLDNESSSVNSLGKVYNVNKEYNEIERFLRENDLLDELAGTMEVAKFGAYHWNILRLPWRLAKQFIPKMSEEFCQADADNLIDYNMFSKKTRFALESIMHRPPAFYLTIIKLRGVKQKFISIVSRIHKAIRPAYRNQRKMLLIINELTDCNQRLSERVDQLLVEMEKK